MLVSSIDYNDYVGRIAIGRIERGVLKQNQEVMVSEYHEKHLPYKSKIVNFSFGGHKKMHKETK